MSRLSHEAPIMPTFSRTTCNGVTAEREPGVDTRIERRATERKPGRPVTRFAKLTNYLAIRWQRAPNLQVFALLSTSPAGSDTAAGTVGGSCRDKRAGDESEKWSKQCEPGKSLISPKGTTGKKGPKRSLLSYVQPAPIPRRVFRRTSETILIGER